MLLIGLSLMLPLFPVAGMTDVTLLDAPAWRRYLDVAHHLFLPALTLASIFSSLSTVGYAAPVCSRRLAPTISARRVPRAFRSTTRSIATR